MRRGQAGIVAPGWTHLGVKHQPPARRLQPLVCLAPPGPSLSLGAGHGQGPGEGRGPEADGGQRSASPGGSPGLSGSHRGWELLSPDPDQGWPTWAGLTLVGHRPLAALPSQVRDVVQGNGPQGWLATQSGLKHDLTGRRRGRVGSQRQSPRLSSPSPAWSARPHLELLGTGHLHLAFQPLVPQVPTRAPHGQLAPGTAQEHPQLALV